MTSEGRDATMLSDLIMRIPLTLLSPTGPWDLAALPCYIQPSRCSPSRCLFAVYASSPASRHKIRTCTLRESLAALLRRTLRSQTRSTPTAPTSRSMQGHLKYSNLLLAQASRPVRAGMANSQSKQHDCKLNLCSAQARHHHQE